MKNNNWSSGLGVKTFYILYRYLYLFSCNNIQRALHERVLEKNLHSHNKKGNGKAKEEKVSKYHPSFYKDMQVLFLIGGQELLNIFTENDVCTIHSSFSQYLINPDKHLVSYSN